MMLLATIFYALILALLLSLFLTYGFKNRGPWGSLWTFWLIVFLGILIADVWLEPIGPIYYGVPWVPLLFVGFLFAILLAVALPRPPKPYEKKPSAQPYIPKVTRKGKLGFFFWILVIVMVIAIILGHFK